MTRLKRLLLKYLPRGIIVPFSGLKFALSGENLRLQRSMANNERRLRMLSKQLLQQYRHLSADPPAKVSINDFEVAVYSQNGEDGILLHLFSVVGCSEHNFVEFGVGDGTQCNTANLSLNFGWQGLLIEHDLQAAHRARRFYHSKLGPQGKVTVRHDTVTAENIDQILGEERLQGEIGLLSIDIDGNDYWVWRAISSIQPRIVVIEYNASLGPRRAIVSEYSDDFDARAKHSSGFYHGASLAALHKLGGEKGYILVGCESAGVNAFFVRQDLAAEKLQPVTPEEAYFPHFHRTRQMTVHEQWRLVADMPFQEV